MEHDQEFIKEVFAELSNCRKEAMRRARAELGLTKKTGGLPKNIKLD